MTGLTTMLEDAAATPFEVDVTGDLRRGHRALHRRRMRTAAGLTGGLAALGVAAAPIAQHLHRHAAPVQVADQPGDPIRTDFYDAPPPPDGWQFEAARAPFVTMIPAGTQSTNIWSFEHKITIMLSAEGWMGFGPSTQYDGRTFYDNEQNEGYSILAVHYNDRYWLQLQYPKSANLPTQQMIEYLDGVVVKPAACTGNYC